jgi:hypothetical protein
MPQLTPNVGSLSELFSRSVLRNLGKDAEYLPRVQAVLGGRHNSWRLNLLVRIYLHTLYVKIHELFFTVLGIDRIF